jgi:hypothetical protein
MSGATLAFTCPGLSLAIVLAAVTSPRWAPYARRAWVWLRWRWHLLRDTEDELRKENLVDEPGHRRHRGRYRGGKPGTARSGHRGEQR